MRIGIFRPTFKVHFAGTLIVLFILASGFDPTPFLSENEGVNIIVIDAGHGGNDGGNSGTGRYKTVEKHVSLDVAKLVKHYIEENLPGTKAVLTRENDTFLELHQRANIANRAGADLFISIHCNAATAKQAYGTESFVLGMGEKDQRLNKTAQMENASMLLEDNWEDNYEPIDPTNPATIIALRAYQDAFLEQSILFADEIQRQFTDRVKRRNRGVKQQPLAVLRHSTMPGVLVELGFLTNYSEEDFLQSQRGKELLASAIYRAVKSYKYTRESRDALIRKSQTQESVLLEVMEERENEASQQEGSKKPDEVQEHKDKAGSMDPSDSATSDEEQEQTAEAGSTDQLDSAPKDEEQEQTAKAGSTDPSDSAPKDEESATTSAGVDEPEPVYLSDPLQVDADSPLYFAVQIAVSRRDLECVPKNFLGLPGIWKSEQYGLFKYYCGRLSQYPHAQALLKKAAAHYPDAYIVAFEQGEKIDVEEAKKRIP